MRHLWASYLVVNRGVVVTMPGLCRCGGHLHNHQRWPLLACQTIGQSESLFQSTNPLPGKSGQCSSMCRHAAHEDASGRLAKQNEPNRAWRAGRSGWKEFKCLMAASLSLKM